MPFLQDLLGLELSYQTHRHTHSNTCAISLRKKLTPFGWQHSMLQQKAAHPTLLLIAWPPTPTTLPHVWCSRMEWTSATSAMALPEPILTVSSEVTLPQHSIHCCSILWMYTTLYDMTSVVYVQHLVASYSSIIVLIYISPQSPSLCSSQWSS